MGHVGWHWGHVSANPCGLCDMVDLLSSGGIKVIVDVHRYVGRLDDRR